MSLKLNNVIIGVYVLLPKSLGKIELMNVAVEDNHQGKGFGKHLVLDAVKKAKKAGYNTIEVGTGNSGIDQLALYQKCGFRMVSIDKDFFTRNYSVDIFENGIQCVDLVRLSKKNIILAIL